MAPEEMFSSSRNNKSTSLWSRRNSTHYQRINTHDHYKKLLQDLTFFSSVERRISIPSPIRTYSSQNDKNLEKSKNHDRQCRRVTLEHRYHIKYILEILMLKVTGAEQLSQTNFKRTYQLQKSRFDPRQKLFLSEEINKISHIWCLIQCPFYVKKKWTSFYYGQRKFRKKNPSKNSGKGMNTIFKTMKKIYNIQIPPRQWQ